LRLSFCAVGRSSDCREVAQERMQDLTP
jgi:hypothetical protein